MMVLLNDTIFTRRPRMAATVDAALACLRREGFDHLLCVQRFEQLCRQHGHHWRQRMLTPALTLRLFLLQVLNGNVAINALRHLARMDFAASSYCDARTRLPLVALQQLLAQFCDQTLRRLRAKAPTRGRVYVVDGSGNSMPDTPELRKHFGLPRPGVVGVSYPTSMILGLLDLASGLFVRANAFAIFTSDLRQTIAVHRSLSAGDILVGDRAFCSLPHIVLLCRRGVDCCFRIRQRDRGPAARGHWRNNRHRPKWMSKRTFATMPDELSLRIVRCRIRHRGYRTRSVRLATTLLDPKLWSDQRIAELYRQRWQIETCFAHLKVGMKMEVLKCKSVDGILKELAVYLMVYNLVRLLMLRWAQLVGVVPRRVSFIDALRLLAAHVLGVATVSCLRINPDRTGRRQLRVRRRRPKHYTLLTCPRSQLLERSQYRRKR
jgi:hypothetical protein